MTTTSQDPKPEPNAGVSPAQGAGEGAARTVPLGEHIDLRKRHRELEEEIARLKVLAANNPPAPAPTAPPTTPPPDPTKDLLRRAAIEDLREELGVDRKQATAVHDMLQANPALSAVEAKSLAAMRNAELFKGSDDGFHPGTHGAARPGVAVPPQPKPDVDPLEDRLKKIGAMPSKSRQDVYLNNLLGSMAAEDVGKPGHSLLPL